MEISYFTIRIKINIDSLIFISLVIPVSLVIFNYITYYISGELNIHYYIVVIVIFVGRILLLLVRGNFLVVILAWEGLGLSSFMLINYYGAWECYNNAISTLIVIRIGDYIIFVIIVRLLWSSRRFRALINSRPIYSLAFLIIVFTKGAQLPFSRWLPKAMRAPTPTSALVHRSTLVTAGLVVIMSFRSLFLNTRLLNVMFYVGWGTILVGRLIALNEQSGKKLVAYRTLSQIGIGIIVYGLGYLHAGYVNLIRHGLAKSLLFIVVGFSIHSSWNRQDIRGLRASRGRIKLVRFAIFLSCASLMGTSFISGMLRKEGIIEIYCNSNMYSVLIGGVILSVYLTFYYSISAFAAGCRFNRSVILMCGSRWPLISSISLSLMINIVYLYWLDRNLVLLSSNPNYSELYTPIYMLYISFFLISSLVTVVYGNFLFMERFIIKVLNTWFILGIRSVKLPETLIYSLNRLFRVYGRTISINVSSLNLSVRTRFIPLLLVGLLIIL